MKLGLFPWVGAIYETTRDGRDVAIYSSSPLDGSVELDDNDYFKSGDLIAGFHRAQKRRVDRIPVQPSTVPGEGDGVAVQNDDFQDQFGQGNRYRIRPEFVIHPHESSYETLGRIGHVRRGNTWEKYLQLSCKKSRYRQPRIPYKYLTNSH
jgi:hypothetical protein